MAKKKNGKKRKHGGNRHKNHHTNDDDVNFPSNQDNVKCSQSLTSDINIAAEKPMPNPNESLENKVVNVSIDANELWIDSKMFDHHQQHSSHLTVPDAENRDSYSRFKDDLIDAESTQLQDEYLKIYNVQCSPTHQQSTSFCNQLLYRHLNQNPINHHHSANDLSLMTDLLDYDNSDTISVEEDCNLIASNNGSDFFNSNAEIQSNSNNPTDPNSLILNALNHCPIDQNYGNTEQKNLFCTPPAISNVTSVNPLVTNNSHSNLLNTIHDHSYPNRCHHRQPTLNDVENKLRSMLIEDGADLNLLDMYDLFENSDRSALVIPSFEDGDSRRLDDYFEDYEDEILRQKLFLMCKNRRSESEDNILFYSRRVRRPLYEKPQLPVPLPIPTQEPLMQCVQPEMKKDIIDDAIPTTSVTNNRKKKRKKKKNKQNQSNIGENVSMGYDPPDKISVQKTMLLNSEMSFATIPARDVLKPSTTNHPNSLAARTDYDDEDDYAGDVDEDSKDFSSNHYPAPNTIDEQHFM